MNSCTTKKPAFTTFNCSAAQNWSFKTSIIKRFLDLVLGCTGYCGIRVYESFYQLLITSMGNYRAVAVSCFERAG